MRALAEIEFEFGQPEATDKKALTVQLPSGAVKTFTGRPAWTLRKLIDAGQRGISSGELPAGLRISHYIFRLRREGVGITAEREKHGGEFAGRHARYKLAVAVSIVGGGL